MKVSEISQYEKSVLVNAVKHSQRKQLLTDKGGWKEWLQVSLQARKLQHTSHCIILKDIEPGAAVSSHFTGRTSSSTGSMSCRC
jgi:hypothetical protein